MSINTWVYRVSDGQFCFGNGPDPSIYLSDSVNYGLADVGDDNPMPDVRTQKWNGIAVIAKSAAELAAYDAVQPLWIDGREVMRRLAASTHLGLERLSQTDATVCKLWNTLKAGGNVNVHSAEFINGAAYLGTVGIPSVWPDVAAFNADRLAQGTA